MPVYFFGMRHDGASVIDGEGEELSDVSSARQLCDQMALSLARNRRPTGYACVFVVNESGSEIHRSYLAEFGCRAV